MRSQFGSFWPLSSYLSGLSPVVGLIYIHVGVEYRGEVEFVVGL